MSYTLVVLAAGMGSRYGGLKQMEAVGPSGEVLLDYSVYDAWKTGADKLVFVIRPELEPAMRERFDHLQDRLAVEYVHQCLDDVPVRVPNLSERTKPWGTGHATYAARSVIDEPFVVINADDYYGPQAYRLVAEFFAEGDSESARLPAFAIVAFRLRNTLSEHGTVSRGLCHFDPAGTLTGIEEVGGLRALPEGDADVANAPSPIRVPGDTPVSMNFWAFTPEVLSLLGEFFTDFLNTAGEEPKAEFYLPAAVSRGITENRCTVRVLETADRWLGMTYRSDHEKVAEGIRQRVEERIYPQHLWGE